MENELKILPLRSVPDDYPDRVMAHIARAESRATRWANAMLGAQLAVTGVAGAVIVILFGGELTSLAESALDNLNGEILSLAQFFGDALRVLNALRIEPLENISPLEWGMLGALATLAWLVVNGVLVVDLRKENTP